MMMKVMLLKMVLNGEEIKTDIKMMTLTTKVMAINMMMMTSVVTVIVIIFLGIN